MGSTISTTDRELNRIIEQQVRESGASKSEIVRTLLRRGLGLGSPAVIPNPVPLPNPGPPAVPQDEEEKPHVWTEEELDAAADQVRANVLASGEAELREELVEMVEDGLREHRRMQDDINAELDRADAILDGRTVPVNRVHLRHGEVLDGRRTDDEILRDQPAGTLHVDGEDRPGFTVGAMLDYVNLSALEDAIALGQATYKPSKAAMKFERLREIGGLTLLRAHDSKPPVVSRLQDALNAKAAPPAADNGHALDLSHAVLLGRETPLWRKVAFWVGGIAFVAGTVWVADRFRLDQDGTPPPEDEPEETPVSFR